MAPSPSASKFKDKGPIHQDSGSWVWKLALASAGDLSLPPGACLPCPSLRTHTWYLFPVSLVGVHEARVGTVRLCHAISISCAACPAASTHVLGSCGIQAPVNTQREGSGPGNEAVIASGLTHSLPLPLSLLGEPRGSRPRPSPLHSAPERG